MRSAKTLLQCCSVLLAALFLQFSLYGQAKDSLQKNDDDKVYEYVDSEARFPGGDTAFLRFLKENLKPDLFAKKNTTPGPYTIVIQFIVDKEGRLSGFTPLTTIGHGMEEEALRVLKRSPNWIPAMQDGKVVKAYRRQPVFFEVPDKKKKDR